jgi:multisubunit Na+/H+ antiporter MnhB subunit
MSNFNVTIFTQLLMIFGSITFYFLAIRHAIKYQKSEPPYGISRKRRKIIFIWLSVFIALILILNAWFFFTYTVEKKEICG